jgi:hypothetical protein
MLVWMMMFMEEILYWEFEELMMWGHDDFWLN